MYKYNKKAPDFRGPSCYFFLAAFFAAFFGAAFFAAFLGAAFLAAFLGAAFLAAFFTAFAMFFSKFNWLVICQGFAMRN